MKNLAEFINRNIITPINESLSAALGFLPGDVPQLRYLNVGGEKDFVKLAQGAVVKALPGVGTLARVGEGRHDELVMPLPEGLLEGLKRIARGDVGSVPLVGSMTVVAPTPRQAGIEVMRELKRERFVQTGH